MGPNPAGIILEGVLAFPGIILKVKESVLSEVKFEWQETKNNEKKINKNPLFSIKHLKILI
jgi:hypothetical protein